ncbi:hypothetical protein [Mycobacterium sp. Root265]|uniref:hypothetical protein n=1 Tax=Mycobacterium sp. Root265 TaxID=1736504 RepID=UPI000B1A605F|nr:hypothetical protein [Mycobacterium sp. Root265]
MKSALQVLALDLGMQDGVHVTRIVAIEIEPTDDLGPEPWAVEWTNDLGDFRHVHYAKKAAQRHVANMLKLLEPDQSKDDVLTVIRRC